MGPDRARARLRCRRGRLHLHPGRRDPRRGERLGDRAARRRPDPQLPRLARGVPGRRAGRLARRPGAVLSPRPTRRDRLADRPLADLLAEHGLTGAPEQPFPTDGWSGSTFSALERGGERFVLKRTSAARDWIVRATRDDAIREAWLANARIPWRAGCTSRPRAIDRLSRGRRGRERRGRDPDAGPVRPTRGVGAAEPRARRSTSSRPIGCSTGSPGSTRCPGASRSSRPPNDRMSRRRRGARCRSA